MFKKIQKNPNKFKKFKKLKNTKRNSKKKQTN